MLISVRTASLARLLPKFIIWLWPLPPIIILRMRTNMTSMKI